MYQCHGRFLPTGCVKPWLFDMNLIENECFSAGVYTTEFGSWQIPQWSFKTVWSAAKRRQNKKQNTPKKMQTSTCQVPFSAASFTSGPTRVKEHTKTTCIYLDVAVDSAVSLTGAVCLHWLFTVLFFYWCLFSGVVVHRDVRIYINDKIIAVW